MAFEKAILYDELPPVGGHHCCGRDGVFTRAQIDYNLVTGGSLLCEDEPCLVSSLVRLPLIGLALRRTRPASLKAENAGRVNSEPGQAFSDNVPMVISSIATLLLPVTAHPAAFRPV